MRRKRLAKETEEGSFSRCGLITITSSNTDYRTRIVRHLRNVFNQKMFFEFEDIK